MSRLSKYLEELDSKFSRHVPSSRSFLIYHNDNYHEHRLVFLNENFEVEKTVEVPDMVLSSVFWRGKLYLGFLSEGVYVYPEGKKVLNAYCIDQLFVFNTKLFALTSDENKIVEVKSGREIKIYGGDELAYAKWVLFDPQGNVYLHYTTEDETFEIAELDFSTGRLGKVIMRGRTRKPAIIAQSEFLDSKHLITNGSATGTYIIDLESMQSFVVSDGYYRRFVKFSKGKEHLLMATPVSGRYERGVYVSGIYIKSVELVKSDNSWWYRYESGKVRVSGKIKLVYPVGWVYGKLNSVLGGGDGREKV